MQRRRACRAATGTASGRRRGPRAAAIRPVGATHRQRAGRGSRPENHGEAALRPEGATQRHPIARSVDRRSYLDDLHGIPRRRTRATDQVGGMAWMGLIAGGRMANPIAREVEVLLGDEGVGRRRRRAASTPKRAVGRPRWRCPSGRRSAVREVATMEAGWRRRPSRRRRQWSTRARRDVGAQAGSRATVADGPSGRCSAVHEATMVAARSGGVPIGAGAATAGEGDGRAEARKAAITGRRIARKPPRRRAKPPCRGRGR